MGDTVLAEVLVPHKYPHDGPQHEVGTTYELPASDFEAFLGMGYVRRCRPHPDHELPGAGGRPGVPHPEPHRGHVDQNPPGTSPPHPDHELPEREPRPRPKSKG